MYHFLLKNQMKRVTHHLRKMSNPKNDDGQFELALVIVVLQERRWDKGDNQIDARVQFRINIHEL